MNTFTLRTGNDQHKTLVFTHLATHGHANVGEWAYLMKADTYLGRVLVLEKKEKYMNALDTWECRLENGGTVAETMEYLEYLKKQGVLKNNTVYLYLLRHETHEELRARTDAELKQKKG